MKKNDTRPKRNAADRPTKPAAGNAGFVRPRNTMYKFIAIVCFVAALLALGAFNERRLMQHYWQRACTGRLWRRRFPDASKTKIRDFLRDFLNAFGFGYRRRLCFAPDDRVMDIYRPLYTVHDSTDSMELEHLVVDLQEKYPVEILVTLGELFVQTRMQWPNIGCSRPAAKSSGRRLSGKPLARRGK